MILRQKIIFFPILGGVGGVRAGCAPPESAPVILVDIVNLFQIREHTWPHSTISAVERIQQICIQSANEEQLLELITNRYNMYINKL
jgi:hypothetical protein